VKTAQTRAEKAEGTYRRAHQHLENGRFSAALRLLHSAAKLGEPMAMHALGYFYDVGTGGRKNRDLAMQWYKRAYRRGFSSAANNIGTIYRDEEDYDRAFAWFNRAMALGDVSANFEIARVYVDHLDDLEKAVPYLRRVAKAKSRVEVTQWEWERAHLLLDGLKAQRLRKYKRAPRRRQDARQLKLAAGV
jgi:uncharacterized protein